MSPWPGILLVGALLALLAIVLYLMVDQERDIRANDEEFEEWERQLDERN